MGVLTQYLPRNSYTAITYTVFGTFAAPAAPSKHRRKLLLAGLSSSSERRRGRLLGRSGPTRLLASEEVLKGSETRTEPEPNLSILSGVSPIRQ